MMPSILLLSSKKLLDKSGIYFSHSSKYHKYTVESVCSNQINTFSFSLTSRTTVMPFENTSILITTELWFIPLDILMILCTVFSVVLAVVFLIIIIFDKACHTVPMMLVANSCLAEVVFGSDMLGTAIFTFINDFKQIQYQDSLCVFRGFTGYVVTVLQNYSYLLQAIYRYIIVVYPTRLSWQSARFQLLFICLTWIFGFVLATPYILTGAIIYDVNNQICQMPLRLDFLTIYNALGVYIIPVSLIVFIYYKIVRYVKEMSKNITTANTLTRAQRELKMIRQIVILVNGVATIGFPYALLILISFFTPAPKYDFRIAYIFVDVSLAFVMVALYKFTEPLRVFVEKRIGWRRNVISQA
jgi:hypothetical protein